MLRQLTLSDVAAQRPLTECTETPTKCEDDTSTTERELLDRAQAHAADVAAEHFPSLPVEVIEWGISTRAQRTAGATKYDPENGEITISLTWDAYDSQFRGLLTYRLRWDDSRRRITYQLMSRCVRDDIQ